MYFIEIGKGMKVIRWRRQRWKEKVLYARRSLLEFRFWCWHKLLEFFVFIFQSTGSAPHDVHVSWHSIHTARVCKCPMPLWMWTKLINVHIQIYWAWYWALRLQEPLHARSCANKRRVCYKLAWRKIWMKEMPGKALTHSLTHALPKHLL